MAFNPDDYLAKFSGEAAFNPDAYLLKKKERVVKELGLKITNFPVLEEFSPAELRAIKEGELEDDGTKSIMSKFPPSRESVLRERHPESKPVFGIEGVPSEPIIRARGLRDEGVIRPLESGDISVVRRIGRSAAGTAGQMITGAGQAGQIAGRLSQKAGKGYDELAKAIGEENILPLIGKFYEGTGETVKKIGKRSSTIGRDLAEKMAYENPEFLDKSISAISSSAVFMLPAIGIMKGVQAFTAIPEIASAFGLATSVLLESSIEAGLAREDAVARGLSEDQADSVGNKVFIQNLPITVIGNKLGVFAKSKNLIGKVARSMLAEGAQEAVQQIPQNIAAGKRPEYGMVESAIYGAIAAGPFGALESISEKRSPQSVSGLPLSPNLDEATRARALQVAQTDPVAAMKLVTPAAEWPGIDRMATEVAESAEAEATLPATEKRAAVQSALAGILQNSLAPAVPAAAVEGQAKEIPSPAVDPQVNFMRTQVGVLRMVSDKMGLKGEQIADLVLDKARDGVTLRNIVQKGIAEGKTPEQMADEYGAFLEGIQRTTIAQEQAGPDLDGVAAPEAEKPATGQPDAPAGRWSDIMPAEQAQGGQAVAAIDMTDEGAAAVILKTGDGRFVVRSEVVDVASPTDEDGLYFNTLDEAKAAIEEAMPEAGVAPAEMPMEQAIPAIQAAPGRADGRPSIPEAVMEYEAQREEARAAGQPVFEQEAEAPEFDMSALSPEAGHPAALPYETARGRFKKLTPEQHKAMVRGRMAAGQVVPDDVMAAYPDLEAESRSQAEAAMLRQEGPAPRPLLDLIVSRGYINRANYEKHWGGELPRDDMRFYLRKDGKVTVFQLAEAAAEAGIIPEASENLLFEAVSRELRGRAIAAEGGAPFLAEPNIVYGGRRAPGLRLGGEGGAWFTTSRELAETFGEEIEEANLSRMKVAQGKEVGDYLNSAGIDDLTDTKKADWDSMAAHFGKLGYDAINFGQMHRDGADDIWVFKTPSLMEPGHKYTQPELFPTEQEVAFTIPPAEAEAKVIDDINNVKPVGQFHDLRLDKAAKRMEKDFKERGVTRFVGQKIETIQDVAEIAAVYRHPFIEHGQLIFVKDGNFVGSTHVTSGMIGNLILNDADIEEGLSRYGADGFYFSHNHPSGNPSPSQEDDDFTKRLYSKYAKFYRGSLVTDHTHFVEINDKYARLYAFKTEKTRFRVGDIVKGKDDLAELKGAPGGFRNPSKVADFARKVLDGSMVGLMFMDTRNFVLSFDHIDPSDDVNAYVYKLSRKYDAPNVIVITGESGFAKMRKKGRFDNMFLDFIVLSADGTYKSARIGQIRGWKHDGDKRMFTGISGSFGETRGEYRPEDYQKAAKRAAPGAKLTARGRINDPAIKGGIPRGASVTVVDMDQATGQVIVDYQGQMAFAGLDMFNETRVQPAPARPGIPVKRAAEMATGVRPVERQVETTEMKLLKAKLSTEQRAARVAAKAVKAELMEDMREGKKDAAALRKSAIEYVGQNVPKAQQYKFVRMLSDAKTVVDLAKVVVRADAEADKAYRRGLVEDIKKVSERALSSMKVDVEYREAVKALLTEFDVTKRRPDTIMRLKAMQEYVNKAEASGKDIFMPDEVRKRLEILTMRPLDEMSNAELENALRDLHIIEAVGREGQAQKELAWEVEKGEWRRDFAAAAKPLTNLPAEMSNAAKRWAWAQETYWALAPMNVLFDRLDGGKGDHSGPHSRMKAVLDSDFFRFLDLKRRHIGPVLELVDKHGLGEDNLNRIGIYAFKVQKDGVNRVLATMPELTREFVERLTLTGQEMEVYRAMRENMEALYPEMKRLMGRLYNREVGKVENYFSMMTDWDKLMDMEVLERLAASPDEFTGMRKNITAGFSKERKPRAKTPIKMNAGKVFVQHMTDLAYFVAMQENVKKFSEITNSEEYVDAVGETGAKITRGWLDLLARQGKAEGSKRIAMLDAMRVNVGSAVLGLKLTSFLIQSTAFMDGAALTGGTNMTQALSYVLSDKQAREWLLTNFPKLRERVGDDIAFRELSETEWLKKIQTMGFVPLKWLDRIMASSSTLSAYMKRAKENGVELDFTAPIDKDATTYANWALDRTQASPFFIDMGVAFNSPKFLFGNTSLNKALLQFKSFVLNRWFFMSYDIPRMQSTADKASAYSWLLAAGALEMGIRGFSKSSVLAAMGTAGMGIASAVKGADDDDDMWQNYALTLLGMIPFVDTPISAMRYGSFPIPVVDTASKAFLGAKDAVGAQNGYRRMVGLRQALTALATLSGVPGTAQVGQIWAWAYNPKTLTFPYNEEYQELVELGPSRTAGETARLRRLDASKQKFRDHARVYREAMRLGNIDMAAGAARRAADALEGL